MQQDNSTTIHTRNISDHLRPRWQKVLRDLWLDRARTAIVLLAMIIGVFGIGIVVDAYAILTREMDMNYRMTNPASAILYIEGMDPELIREIQALPAVAAAEGRRVVSGRIQTGPDTWRMILLFMIEDFEQVRVDTFTPQAGQYPPRAGEIALERAAFPLTKRQLGETAALQIPGQPVQTLSISGSVHAAGLAPAWMEGFAYGFITPATMQQLGGETSFNELRVVFRDVQDDETRIRARAEELQDWLAARGQTVTRLQIPRPGKHPHADQMSSLLFLLEAFGLLALILSGILVVTMISALLSQQIRQIGVMKAVGGRMRQVAGLYFGSVAVLGLISLGFGIPLALAGGRGYAAIAAQMLNFNLNSTAVPLWAYLLQAAVGLLVPLLAAAYPVWRGSRISVREALSDYGIRAEGKQQGAGMLDRMAGKADGLTRPLLLSIRNTFRRTGRLIFTLLALAMGGAMFVVAMNISASMDRTVAREFEALRFDVLVGLNKAYPLQQVQEVVLGVPGITGVEGRGSAKANRVLPNGSISERQFNLTALPADTTYFTPTLLAGRWLKNGDTDAVVVNHKLQNELPDVQVGVTLRLKTGGLETEWQVVGVVREAVAEPTIYVPYETFVKHTGQTGTARSLAVALQNHDPAAQAETAQRLEAGLADASISVSDLMPISDLRQRVADHLQLIAFFLGLMSVLVVIVGGLGLASTMSINVLERRRELGILRSIGASSPVILRILLSEGILIGLLSWALACLLAWPLGVLVGNIFGNIFFQVPLYFAYSPVAVTIWLVLSILLAAGASFYAARGAMRLTVREVLAYE